jgi:CO dehydrogenase nickel-insertion accessory protein CooC1
LARAAAGRPRSREPWRACWPDGATIDGDPNPNLALTLGIPVERIETLPTLPSDLVERTEDGFRPTRTLDEVCSSHAVEGSDGVRLLVMAYPRRADTG